MQGETLKFNINIHCMSVGLTELSLMLFSELKAETSHWINPHTSYRNTKIKIYIYWIIM